MGKKKKAGKKVKGGAKKSNNIEIELQPEPTQMPLLYRKASFDILDTPMEGLLRVQYDQLHRAVVPGYCEFLKNKKFWLTGDEIPEGVAPKAPCSSTKKSGEKKKKKK